jgi:UDP-GlcNAc:undecaprenyl-phosphate GlcNAc-1-phosphate transferase
MTFLVAPFFLALLIALTLTPICRFLASNTGYVAKPTEDRWHKRPTALFGGAGDRDGDGKAGHC